MKEQIGQKILDQFAAMSARAGHCLDERWILHKLKPSLNPKEQMEIDAAIDHLRTQKLIEVSRRTGMLALVLTVAGYDAIYPNDPAAAKKKIRQAILDGFSRSRSQVGHCLDARWIQHQVVPQLNPRESEQLEPAIHDMVQEGLIDVSKRSSMTILALTQKGFDAIY